MTCSTCETPLPEAAEHCPHCGSLTPNCSAAASIAPNDPTLLSSPVAGIAPPLPASSLAEPASSFPYEPLAYATPYESVGGAPPPPPRRPARRVSLLVGIALLVLLLSGSGVFVWLFFPLARHGAPAGTAATSASTAQASATSGAGVTGLPVSSPSASTPSSSPVVSTLSRLTYRGHSSDVHAVAWSPDGTLIASGSDDHTVQVWDASTGARLLLYQGHTASVAAVAWSPDGTLIASGSADSTVQVWKVE